MAKKVLITGANSGIGIASLRTFMLDGWDVTATVRSDARAAELGDLLRDEGLAAEIVLCELSDRRATDTAVATILQGGVPDVIVNNAAATVFGPVELADDASIDLQFETNLVGPLRLLRGLIPHFRVRGSGAIVNLSSAWGFTAQECVGLYAASKHAIEAVSEALYYELQPFNVRVAIVEPGRTATSAREKLLLTPGFGPGTPYWGAFAERNALLDTTIWKDGWAEDPRTVANTIFAAATTSTPALRWLVGRDTQLVARLRGRDALDTYDERSLQALRELADPAKAE